jgi:hypothetical protein
MNDAPMSDVSRIDYPCGCAVETWQKHAQVTAVRHCARHAHIVLDDWGRPLDQIAAEIDAAARRDSPWASSTS